MTNAVLLHEAIPLLHVLVDRVASEAGVRVLAIKGPIAAAQDLRGKTSPVDVDVLVDPRGRSKLLAALESQGWYRTGFEDTPGIMPRHSTVYRHETWPTELDIHHWYPGMLGEPDMVFDALWARRSTVELAHQYVTTTDAVGTAMVTALTILRDARYPAHAVKLHDLVERARTRLSDDGPRHLAELAAQIGAAETAGPFLASLDAPDIPNVGPTVVDVADWHLVADAPQEVLPWLVGLSRVAWYRRPAFVWRAVWLPADRFREWEPNNVVTGVDVLRARLAPLRTRPEGAAQSRQRLPSPPEARRMSHPSFSPFVAWVGDEDRVVVLAGASISAAPFVLNGSASQLWVRLWEGASESEIADKLADAYGMSFAEAAACIEAFVADCESRGLINRQGL